MGLRYGRWFHVQPGPQRARPAPPLPYTQVRINGYAAELPREALQLTAGEVQRVGLPFTEGAFQVWPVMVSLAAPDRPCNISVAGGALAGVLGEPSAASNTLRMTWKTAGPHPTIGTIGKYASTTATRIPLLIDFGERITQLNPLGLFNATGLGR